MARKKTQEEFIQELKIINNNIQVLGDYTGIHNKIMVKCKVCKYEWEPEPNSLLSGIGCPACSGRVPIKGLNDFATLHPELLKEWDYDRNSAVGLYPNEITHRSGKKAFWICQKCGNKWVATIDKRVNGAGCPECAKEVVTYKRINRFIQKRGSLFENHPELMKEWDYDNNEGLDPLLLTNGSNRMAYWVCKKCGYNWMATISNRTKGSGCPVCSNKIVIKGKNDISTVNPELLLDWDYEKNKENGITPEMISVGSEYNAYWVCHYCGHKWQALVYSRNAGVGCPECAKRWQISLPEKTLYYYIKRAFSDTLSQYSPDWIKPSEIDIYIPSLSIGIEYDGQAWHQDIKKDLMKDIKCKENDIKIIHVREPLCPPYPDSKCVYVRKDRRLSSLDDMVNGVFDIIEFLGDIELEDRSYISFIKDRSTILNEVGFRPLEDSIADLPNIRELWDYEKNNGLIPEYFSKGSNIRVNWKCNVCGYEWNGSISDRVKAKSICPNCAGKIVKEGENDFATLYPELLKEWDYEYNNSIGIFPTDIKKTSHIPVGWICSKCGWRWKTKLENRIFGKTGCPQCYSKRRKSKVKKVGMYSQDNKLLNIYNSSKEAAIDNNCIESCIQSVCRGDRKTHKGFKWKYM